VVLGKHGLRNEGLEIALGMPNGLVCAVLALGAQGPQQVKATFVLHNVDARERKLIVEGDAGKAAKRGDGAHIRESRVDAAGSDSKRHGSVLHWGDLEGEGKVLANANTTKIEDFNNAALAANGASYGHGCGLWHSVSNVSEFHFGRLLLNNAPSAKVMHGGRAVEAVHDAMLSIPGISISIALELDSANGAVGEVRRFEGSVHF
jgi:hypothetical protein